MEIKKADKGLYAEEIGRIHSSAWRQAYKNIFPDAYIQLDTSEKRSNDFLNTLYYDSEEYFLIYADGVAIGIVNILIGDVCELKSLYFLSQSQNHGYGTRVIEFIKCSYSKCPITLWVLEKNTKAVQFYIKNNFTYTGEKRIIFRGENFTQLQFKFEEKQDESHL